VGLSPVCLAEDKCWAWNCGFSFGLWRHDRGTISTHPNFGLSEKYCQKCCV